MERGLRRAWSAARGSSMTGCRPDGRGRSRTSVYVANFRTERAHPRRPPALSPINSHAPGGHRGDARRGRWRTISTPSAPAPDEGVHLPASTIRACANPFYVNRAWFYPREARRGGDGRRRRRAVCGARTTLRAVRSVGTDDAVHRPDGASTADVDAPRRGSSWCARSARTAFCTTWRAPWPARCVYAAEGKLTAGGDSGAILRRRRPHAQRARRCRPGDCT